MNVTLIATLYCSLSMADAPVFQALVTSGWNEKASVEFSVRSHRRFVWRSGNTERKGTLQAATLDALISHVEAAKPGPVANDAGTLQVTWHKNGKTASKVFYFPSRAPALELVKEIDTITSQFDNASKPATK